MWQLTTHKSEELLTRKNPPSLIVKQYDEMFMLMEMQVEACVIASNIPSMVPTISSASVKLIKQLGRIYEVKEAYSEHQGAIR